MRKIDKVIKILTHFGHEHQKLKAVEELTELQELILKNVNKGDPAIGIASEIADVRIMLLQLEMIYEVDPRELDDIIEFKLDRTMQRISAENDHA